MFLYWTGKPAEALKSLESALAIQQRLADENPTVTLFQGELAVTHDNIGYVLGPTGKGAEALTILRAGTGDPPEAGRR